VPEPTLVLDRVTAGYGERAALREVSITVNAGEVVGLVGPNGSGKTTLVRVASRALEPWSGTVHVGGRDPFAMRSREAARLVAVVPQDLVPAFPFSVLEMVLMGRSPYRSSIGRGSAGDWARARDAMEAANVQHLADRSIDELSGGERQRVVLAQALAQDAPVLLLDEPTTHLDVRHVLDLLGMVRGLASRDGKAVLAIFHELNVAAATSDRMVALSEGRVVAEGAPEDVVTPDLLRSVYGVEAAVHPDPLTGRPAVALGPPPTAPSLRGGHATIHVVGGAGRAAPLVRSLAERGFDVTVGVLHATDTDAVLAERLNLLRVTVPPFSEIDDEAANACLDLMLRASAVVVCDAPYGPGNLPNLRLALAAVDRGWPVVLLDQVPMAERDFTGGVATRLWEELRARADVQAGYDGVLAAVGALAGG
jgi:iron complex transport system ATP-binding protein